MPDIILIPEIAKARFRMFGITLPPKSPSMHKAMVTTATQGTVAGDAGAMPGLSVSGTVAGGSSRNAESSAAASAESISGWAGASVTVNPIRFPPALFHAASSGSEDVDSQRSHHEFYNSYLEHACRGLQVGLSMWRQRAGLVDVTITGPTALGGRLQGPRLEPLILAYMPKHDTWHLKVSTAIAKGVSESFDLWMASVSVPGLPWYPRFAAVPSPVAPPMPNVPTPLLALSQDHSQLSPAKLRSSMSRRLQGGSGYSQQTLESVAVALSHGFAAWKGIQLISFVMGTGPVPTFAPPYVPVGPVVGGSILPGPHLIL